MEDWYMLSNSGGRVPCMDNCVPSASVVGEGTASVRCESVVTSKPRGTDGRSIEVSAGASFSFVLLWLSGGGSLPASGRLLSGASLSSLIGFCGGGVDATTSGSMGGGCVGLSWTGGSWGMGNSLYTICCRQC